MRPRVSKGLLVCKSLNSLCFTYCTGRNGDILLRYFLHRGALQSGCPRIRSTRWVVFAQRLEHNGLCRSCYRVRENFICILSICICKCKSKYSFIIQCMYLCRLFFVYFCIRMANKPEYYRQHFLHIFRQLHFRHRLLFRYTDTSNYLLAYLLNEFQFHHCVA